MHYHAAESYLYSFLNFEHIPFRYRKQLNPQRMSLLLSWFEHPEKKFFSVVVGGTNGKGAVTNFLSDILIASGQKTGMYTSPHLSKPRERIRLNGKMISEEEFAELLTAMRYVIEGKKKEAKHLGPITFFEVFTLLAMIYFAKKNVRFGIFEVGMGGRLDATNVLNPALTILTPIGRDHELYLGNTIEKIAREKAALIKLGGRVIVGSQPREAKKVIRKKLHEKKAKGYFLNSAFEVQNKFYSKHGGRFTFKMDGMRLARLRIQLSGKFQIENAACALAALKVLKDEFAFELDRHKLRRALKLSYWPGRFEILRRGAQTVVLDGAHNESGSEVLHETLHHLFPREEKIVIFGISRDKNIDRVLPRVAALASYVIATKSQNQRALEPKVILESLNEMNVEKPCFWTNRLKSALETAKSLKRPKSVLVVTGSIFLVSEAREALKCPPLN
jgi:dihydrofolate synthase / folylpolyglutamate synthase